MVNEISDCNEMLRKIDGNELQHRQLLLILESKNSVKNMQAKIDAKINSQNEVLKKICLREEDNTKSNDQNQKISDLLYSEVELITEKIKKIELKKILAAEDLSKS